MPNPYTAVPIVNYNASPPPDDGSTGSNNKLSWAGIKGKLSDPLNTALALVDAHVASAFALAALGGALAGLNTDYTLLLADQGKSLVFTGSTPRTLTLLSAAVGTNPFVVGVQNNMTAALTITPFGTQTINGGSAGGSITLGPKMGGLLMSDGSNFIYLGPTAGQYIDSGAKTLFFTGAPTGWTVDGSINDAGIKLVSGAPGADAGTVAFSSIFTQITIAQANLPSYSLPVTDPGHFHNGGGNTVRASGGLDSLSTTPDNHNTTTNVTNVTVASGGSATPLDFRMKTAQANRCSKN